MPKKRSRKKDAAKKSSVSGSSESLHEHARPSKRIYVLGSALFGEHGDELIDQMVRELLDQDEQRKKS